MTMTDLDGHICSDCGVYFTTEPDVLAWRCESCRPAPDPDAPVKITTERVLVGVDLARGEDQTAVAACTVNQGGTVTLEEISRKIQEEIARAVAIPPKILRSKDTRRKMLADIMRAKKD